MKHNPCSTPLVTLSNSGQYNGLPSMPPCEDLRMIAELACERQTFLLAHRHWGTFLLVKRPAAAMSEEKRLPRNVPQWRWARRNVCRSQAIAESITSSLNCLTMSPFNSCFGGYVSRSRLASSRCSNEKRIANSSSSERVDCEQSLTKVPETAISLHRVKWKNRTKTGEADSKKFINCGDSFIFIM